jgi:hypothetical protein
MGERRQAGTYWSVQFSSDWRKLVPWSLDGKDMPYFGARVSEKLAVKMRTIGPIALISVTL